MANKKKNQSEYNEEELTKKIENSLGSEDNDLTGTEEEQDKLPNDTPPIITPDQDKTPEPEVKKEEEKKPESKPKKTQKKEVEKPKKKVSELSASEYRFYMNTGFLPDK